MYCSIYFLLAIYFVLIFYSFLWSVFHLTTSALLKTIMVYVRADTCKGLQLWLASLGKSKLLLGESQITQNPRDFSHCKKQEASWQFLLKRRKKMFPIAFSIQVMNVLTIVCASEHVPMTAFLFLLLNSAHLQFTEWQNDWSWKSPMVYIWSNPCSGRDTQNRLSRATCRWGWRFARAALSFFFVPVPAPAATQHRSAS